MLEDIFVLCNISTVSNILRGWNDFKAINHSTNQSPLHALHFLQLVVLQYKKIVVGCLLSCIMSCSLNCEGRGEEIASDSHPISVVTSEDGGGRRGYSGFNVATTRGNWLRFQFVQRMEKICNELIYNLLDSRQNERELWGINFSLHNPVGVNRYFQLPRVF